MGDAEPRSQANLLTSPWAPRRLLPAALLFLTGWRASGLWDTRGPGLLTQTRQPYQNLVPGQGQAGASLPAGRGQLDSRPRGSITVCPDGHSGPPSLFLWMGRPCVVSGPASCVSGCTASTGDVCSSSPRTNKRLETARRSSDPAVPHLAAGVRRGRARHAGAGGEVRTGLHTGPAWWVAHGWRVPVLPPARVLVPSTLPLPALDAHSWARPGNFPLPVPAKQPQRYPGGCSVGGPASSCSWAWPDSLMVPSTPSTTERALPSWHLSPEQGPLPSCPACPGRVLHNP